MVDCVLRTPLKGARQSRHYATSAVTPPAAHPDKKRKFRSASSTLNENAASEPFGTKSVRRNGHGCSQRGSLARRINSEPSSLMQARNDALYSALALSEHDASSPYRPTKRPRISSFQPDAEDDILVGGNDRDKEHLGRELHHLHLDEAGFLAEDGHICAGGCSCQQLIIRMNECLERERKARRHAEENHLVELQKRLEMERLVEMLQARLLSI
ncbi:hypothetical protein FPV67DRAFT_56737 [Lyophyllum atratum]|nr:hypothetical protein FPV67DRAFT_56737 [Lyophyllum atratum]